MRKAIGPKPSPGLYGGKKTKKGKRNNTRHRKKKNTRRNKKQNTRYRKGGSKHGSTLLPQPLVNLGRDMMFNGKSFINSFVGAPPPINPDPTVQPIIL